MSDQLSERLVNIHKNNMAQSISSLIDDKQITVDNSVGDLLRVIRGEKIEPRIHDMYSHTELHAPYGPHICYRYRAVYDDYIVWHSTWNRVNRAMVMKKVSFECFKELVEDIQRMTGQQVLLVDYDALEKRQTDHALKVAQMMDDNV